MFVSLWFDVEEGHNTTLLAFGSKVQELWFDVEEGHNTTLTLPLLRRISCGLM